jgi:hypothetical protein
MNLKERFGWTQAELEAESEQDLTYYAAIEEYQNERKNMDAPE